MAENSLKKAWTILSLLSSHLAELHRVRALPTTQDSFCEVVGVDSSFFCRGSASLLQQERFRMNEPTGSLPEMASSQPKASTTSLAPTPLRQRTAPRPSRISLGKASRRRKALSSLTLKEARPRNPVQSWARLANKSNVSNASNITSAVKVTGNPLAAKEDVDDPKCTPGHHCGNGSMPAERSICIPCMNGTGSNQCWDVCNTAHHPEDYDIGDGDKTFARQLAQIVRDARAGKVEQLKCPGLGAGAGSAANALNASTNSSTNKSMNGTRTKHLKDQLLKKTSEIFQASQIAGEASAKAADLTKAAQDEFVKALNTSNRSALSHAIELWKETTLAHAEAFFEASNASESLRELGAGYGHGHLLWMFLLQFIFYLF